MPSPTTPTEAIVGRLLATAGVTSLVGVNVGPGIPTQDTVTDYVIVYRSAGGGGMRLGSPTTLNQYSMRVDAYAGTEAKAEAILKACVVALAGWRDRTQGVQGCFPTEDADEQDTDDEGGGAYRISGQTFSLWFQG
jgi:hypothetical protein